MSQLVKSYVRGKDNTTEPQRPTPSNAVPMIMLVGTLAVSALVFPAIILSLVMAVIGGYTIRVLTRKPEAPVSVEATDDVPAKKRRTKKPKFQISLSI